MKTASDARPAVQHSTDWASFAALKRISFKSDYSSECFVSNLWRKIRGSSSTTHAGPGPDKLANHVLSYHFRRTRASHLTSSLKLCFLKLFETAWQAFERKRRVNEGAQKRLSRFWLLLIPVIPRWILHNQLVLVTFGRCLDYTIIERFQMAAHHAGHCTWVKTLY